MYVKYRVPGCGIHVREVKHFAIRNEECQEKDGTITAGAELYDASYETKAEALDAFAEYLASLVVEDVRQVEAMRQPHHNPIESVYGTYGHDYADEASLMWLNSHESAKRIMDNLCRVMEDEKRFLDLTLYGEDGRRKDAEG